MEIPKALQEEIISVQTKLMNAIREHQIYVGKLKEDPNNPDIRGQIQRIQLNIVALGRCQKQIVERLRKVVQSFEADNVNGWKVSIASLLGLNNNNHIMNNNEAKRERPTNGFKTKPSKEDYEEIVRNGDVPSPERLNNCAKRGPSSVETISGEDDIVEVPMDENSNEKQEEIREEPKTETMGLEEFLFFLGLITKSKATELQNKRAERKRRSTANPHFVYSMMEQPVKRQKRHSYLQSGNAPHTRQTTARMNGPSPPPNKAQATKSTSPQSRTTTKSLIPVQKTTTRPNILRNADSRVYMNRNKVEDNQTAPSPVPNTKIIQSIISNKTLHIPGLPSSLTIERIDNDTVVCITCRNRNSGPLTVCEICSRSYHVSCHATPAPSSTCPKCVIEMEVRKDVQKNEAAEDEEQTEGDSKQLRVDKGEKLAAATLASGAIGKARENSEIHKTTSGLHKADASEKKRVLSNAFNQLPASTFLIPISPNGTSNVDEPENDKLPSPVSDNDQRQQDVVPRNPVVLRQSQRSDISYVQTEEQMSYTCQLPSTSVQSEKHKQSYLIVKKITEPGRKLDQLITSQTDEQGRSTVVNYQLPTMSGYNSSLEAGIVVAHSLLFGRNKRKRQTARAIPALHRIIGSEGLLPVTSDYQLDRATLNGRKPWAKLSRGKLCINQQSVSRPAAETLLSCYSDSSKSFDEHLQITRSSIGSSVEDTASYLDGRVGKHRTTRVSKIIHSLFPGNNRAHIISDRARESRSFGANDRDYPLLRQQLCRLEHGQLEPCEQPDKPATSSSSATAAAVQLQRRALTRFFEHVKLEEAHIPAPFGTKLVHKKEIALERDEFHEKPSRQDNQRYNEVTTSAKTTLLTSPYNSDEDSHEDRGSQRDRGTTLDNEMSRDSCNSVTNWPSLCHSTSVSSLTRGDNYELNQVNAQSSALIFRLEASENNRSESTLLYSDDVYHERDQSDSGKPFTAQSNLSKLRNEVSVPDDKADTERQDLPSGGRRLSRSSSSCGSSSGGGSSSSNTSSSSRSSSSHSDTPDQAMNGLSPSHISEDMYELLNTESNSPEGKEELVRYMSAIHGSDHGDAATD